jgi:8-oxo-dGTP pyrophosphatase MutT (NUDIX family)
LISKTNSLHQVSAGGVVFRSLASGFRICLIGRRKASRIIWCLPKGHVEKGESLKEAALRETREETGITGSLLNSLDAIQYSFFDLESQKNVNKTVHFFLVRYEQGKLSDHDDEAEYARWFPMDQALKRIEYPGERAVLRKAVKRLSNTDEQKRASVS